MRTKRLVHFARSIESLFASRTTIGAFVLLIAVYSQAVPASAADLKVMKMGLGSGTVSSVPIGIDCGVDCDETYASSVSVTLTADADAGSNFVGWDVDADGDPDTVADCSGPSNTCLLAMDQDRSVRPVFDLDPATIPAFNRSPDLSTPDPDDLLAYSPEEIATYLGANTDVNSAARFIAALPDDFKQNWILMSRSESLQTGTAEFPRILLASADAKAVFTLGLETHSAYPGAHPNAIEYMQWDPNDKNFRFHEIVVADIPEMNPDMDEVGIIPLRLRGVFADENRCSKCHSTRNVRNPGSTPGTTGTSPGIVKFKSKPNWDAYDSWGGMAPFNRDRIYQGSLEAATTRKIFNPWTWRGNDLVRSIVHQLKLQPPGASSTDAITRLRGGANDGVVKFAFDASPPVFPEPPPSGTSTTNITYSFDGAAGTPPGTDIQQGGSFVTLQNPDLLPPSGEGRGVQLFDLLGGSDGSLNAQRVADEVIDHRFATGGGSIDVRPIALAITKLERCVVVDESANTVTSNPDLPGLPVLDSSGLEFFAARHGMSINELVADTRERAESLPIRKADIQRLNLDRTGDIYQDLTDPANGLIQQYGGGTTDGMSTDVSRLRQEVFRRPAGTQGDATVMGGKYVDRELYGVRIERTALYRFFLEPLGVSVDKWSMGVRGRSRTYTFADVFSQYRPVLDAQWVDSLTTMPFPGLTDPTSCAQLITAINNTMSSLPAADAVPTYTDVQRIFNKSCIECHGNLDYPPYSNYSSPVYLDTLDLSEDESPPSGSDRLDRSHGMASSRSLLYQRITGNGDLLDDSGAPPQPNDPNVLVLYDPAVTDESCPNFTGLMPCGGPPLSQADILTIDRWIEGGRPNTRGDPHIKTIDGVNYDFQAAGEFVLLRGQNFEVQARQTAVETSSALGPNAHTGLTSCVSVNSAAAVRVGPHRITYQPDLSGEPNPDGLQLRIDGELRQMSAEGIPLTSGVRIVQTTAPGGIQIEAPGGTAMILTPGWWAHYQLWYLNIDGRRIRATQGVMGTIAPGNWLPALPDGSFMGPKPKDLLKRYNDLYGKFGNAWRVTDATTLFDYAPGTSTATFTIASWPNGESPNSCKLPPQPPGVIPAPPLAALPLEVAEQHCSDIVADDARHNCIQDVMVTGEPGFAQTYLLSEQIEFNAIPAAPVLVSPEDNATGLDRPVTFTWNPAIDLDGDSITYRHCLWLVGERPDNNECEAVSIQTTSWGGSFIWVLLAILIGCLFFAVLIFVGVKKQPALLASVAIAILAAVILTYRFGASGTISRPVTELASGEDYYWKVIAKDGKGGSVESKTRRFEIN